MPSTITASYGVTYKLRCEHCERDQSMGSVKNLDLGQIISPASPGGSYGTCLFCKKPGLKVIDRIESDRVK